MQGLLAGDLMDLDLVMRLFEEFGTRLRLQLLNFDGGFDDTRLGRGRGGSRF
jgi:hypothetical protein